MNIDGYRESVHQGLRRLEELIAKANDIVDNRIVKNLKIISRAVLVDMPMVSLLTEVNDRNSISLCRVYISSQTQFAYV